jgi:hypothetical protein
LYGDTVGLAFSVEVFAGVIGEREQFIGHELGLYFTGLGISLLELGLGCEPTGNRLA